MLARASSISERVRRASTSSTDRAISSRTAHTTSARVHGEIAHEPGVDELPVQVEGRATLAIDDSDVGPVAQSRGVDEHRWEVVRPVLEHADAVRAALRRADLVIVADEGHADADAVGAGILERAGIIVVAPVRAGAHGLGPTSRARLR